MGAIIAIRQYQSTVLNHLINDQFDVLDADPFLVFEDEHFGYEVLDVG